MDIILIIVTEGDLNCLPNSLTIQLKVARYNLEIVSCS